MQLYNGLLREVNIYLSKVCKKKKGSDSPASIRNSDLWITRSNPPLLSHRESVVSYAIIKVICELRSAYY